MTILTYGQDIPCGVYVEPGNGTAIPTPQCPYCGCVPHQHISQCPLVTRVEYYPDGRIKSVEKRST